MRLASEDIDAGDELLDSDIIEQQQLKQDRVSYASPLLDYSQGLK